jgi:acyl carrier protein
LIHRRLEEVFRTVYEDPEFELSSDATADTIAGWDSLTHIILMVAIEQESAFASEATSWLRCAMSASSRNFWVLPTSGR